ncbi:UNVERIFIED_CONTAM: hypothetical protein Sradi_3784300 [Sesamum radiatum]|uniref:Reverse transcriptase n=1 Tax=Sesamum radiatum TaxID=300843 RepID=A0AAW2PZX0_SESRA
MEGVEVEGHTALQRVILDYFFNIFNSTRLDGRVIEEIVSCLEPKVTEAINQELMHPFTSKEVKQAFDAMYPLKSSGPDDMSPIFFQKFWPLLGLDVCHCVLHILNEHVLNDTLNHTHIVILPKCSHFELVYDFRPISLFAISCIKLTSKAIANHIKPLFHNLISQLQFAGVPNCSILDNVLVAYEVNHYQSHKYQGSLSQVSLKFDLSKAYDRVE